MAGFWEWVDGWPPAWWVVAGLATYAGMAVLLVLVDEWERQMRRKAKEIHRLWLADAVAAGRATTKEAAELPAASDGERQGGDG